MEEQLKLENQTCFPLYALSREITNAYRPLLEEIDLTYPQYLVLLVLWENKTVTVNQLGEKLYLDSGTLTPLLKRLQGKGLIDRTRSKRDERVVEISLTAAGEQLEQQALKIPEKLAESLRLSIDELTKLREITCTILQKI
ncbi:MarR family transcriptional regulator [Sphingobacterium oryzagri]|uniref:HTH-type transcriptional regulator SarZ n=1 Tax=Sphingobacterium oryzagri TaxID=3025669 RepID=A0ABY7WKC7_9SPHI|nr:MarR family transcriptional regulator [Sphingobacterium sp. KACC 22765]WDF70042.1 MarR family transcriptional regulator [Sphingobacterium sp. KACC 22765]